MQTQVRNSKRKQAEFDLNIKNGSFHWVPGRRIKDF